MNLPVIVSNRDFEHCDEGEIRVFHSDGKPDEKCLKFFSSVPSALGQQLRAESLPTAKSHHFSCPSTRNDQWFLRGVRFKNARRGHTDGERNLFKIGTNKKTGVINRLKINNQCGLNETENIMIRSRLKFAGGVGGVLWLFAGGGWAKAAG